MAQSRHAASENQQSALLRLPPEIRLKIYEILTPDGKVTERWLPHVRSPRGWNLKPAASIYQTCQALRKESLIVFSKRTTKLVLLRALSRESISEIPQHIRDHISTLEVFHWALEFVNWDFLPNIKKVRIICERTLDLADLEGFQGYYQSDRHLLDHTHDMFGERVSNFPNGTPVLITYRLCMSRDRYLESDLPNWEANTVTAMIGTPATCNTASTKEVQTARVDYRRQLVVSKKVKARDWQPTTAHTSTFDIFRDWSEVEDDR